MPSPKIYTPEEVLKWTVEDFRAVLVQNNNGLDIRDSENRYFENLPQEQQDQCLVKIRDLIKRSAAPGVDAQDLTERLSKLQEKSTTSLSKTTRGPELPSKDGKPRTPSPRDPNSPGIIAQEFEEDTEAHRRLLDDQGRPCYPIDLGPGLLNHPGKYQDIISVFQEGMCKIRLVFTSQLLRWRQFRRHQLNTRQRYLPQNQFREFQQEVHDRRRRHGLNGSVQLLEDHAQQSDLVTWTEYQDYELQRREEFEHKLREHRELRQVERKELAAIGISVFEDYEEADLGQRIVLIKSLEPEGGEARIERCRCTLGLEVGKKRLDVAQSDNFGVSVERTAWVTFFAEQLDLANRQKNELQTWKELDKEWYNKEAEKLQLRDGETDLDYRRRYRAAMDSHEEQKREVDRTCLIAKYALKEARADEFGDTIAKAALIEMLEHEIQSMELQLEEANTAYKRYLRKYQLIGILAGVHTYKQRLKTQEILLTWVEQQREQLLDDDTENGNNPRSEESQVVAFKPFPDHSATDIGPDEHMKAEHPTPEKSPMKSQKEQGSQAAGPPIVSESIKNLSSQLAGAAPDQLHATSQSVSSKPIKKGKTPVQQTEDQSASTKARAKRRRAARSVQDVPLRRSTRVSKPPERFQPG